MSRYDAHQTDAASFEAIRTALAQSARGRDFLADLARRAQAQDTRQLLNAIARLERRIAGRTAQDETERRRRDFAEIISQIEDARRGVADLIAEAEASIGPDAGRARILDAAEQIGETAWTMREGGLDPALCDALDRHASEISAACASRDLLVERTTRMLASLRPLEAKLRHASESWAAQEVDGSVTT